MLLTKMFRRTRSHQPITPEVRSVMTALTVATDALNSGTGTDADYRAVLTAHAELTAQVPMRASDGAWRREAVQEVLNLAARAAIRWVNASVSTVA